MGDIDAVNHVVPLDDDCQLADKTQSLVAGRSPPVTWSPLGQFRTAVVSTELETGQFDVENVDAIEDRKTFTSELFVDEGDGWLDQTV